MTRGDSYPHSLRPRDDIRENMDCYNCGQKNHMAQHCFKPTEQQYKATLARPLNDNPSYGRPKKSLQGDVVCDFCSYPWHESRHCLLNKNRIRAVPSRGRSRSPRPAPRSRINLVNTNDDNDDYSHDKDLEDSWDAEPAESAIDALEFDNVEVIELKQPRVCEYILSLMDSRSNEELPRDEAVADSGATTGITNSLEGALRVWDQKTIIKLTEGSQFMAYQRCLKAHTVLTSSARSKHQERYCRCRFIGLQVKST